MSEQTGASPEQIEAAVERAYATWGYGEGMPHVLGPEVRQAARFLVPPGMKIVPADAVVISADVAATAAEACEDLANRAGKEYEANCYPMLTPGRHGWLAEHDRYRAAAAALRGGGNG